MTLLGKSASGFGSPLSVSWKFDTSTANGAPAAGYFRFDSSDPESIGWAYLANVAASGLSVRDLLLALKENDRLIIEQAGDTAKVFSFFLDNVIEAATGYVRLSISASATGGLPAAGAVCAFSFQYPDRFDVDAIHLNATAEFTTLLEKAAPVGADVLVIEDSESTPDAGVKKYVQISNLPGGGSLTPPVSPTDDGKVAVASSGDLAYTKGTANQVLVTNAGATSYAWTKLTENHIDEAAALKAAKLASATTTIDVVAATAPTSGQVLTATSGTAATWQTPTGGTDAAAIHDNVDGEINAIAEKVTPVDADVLLIEDSAASYAKKRVRLENFPAFAGGQVMLPQPTAFETASGTLPSVRRAGMLFATESHLYYCGGDSDGTGTATNTIYVASTATPTTWTTSGNTLPAPLFGAWQLIIGNTAYLIGGKTTGSVDVNTIYSASLSDLTTWTNTGATLPSARFRGFAGQAGNPFVDVAGGKIWIFGTRNGTAATDEVLTANVATPTTWSVHTGILPTAVYEQSLVVSGDRVYLVGGVTSAAIATAVHASIGDFPTGAWTSITSVVPTATRGMESVVIGDHVYYYSGTTTAPVATIYRAPLSDPTLLRAVGSLPAACMGAPLAIIDGYMYFFGGIPSGTAPTANILKSKTRIAASLVTDSDDAYTPRAVMRNIDGSITVQSKDERNITKSSWTNRGNGSQYVLRTVGKTPVTSEWKAYTPTLTAATTNPTLGTGAELLGSWRRVGDSIEIMQTIRWGNPIGSVGSGNYYFGLPAGIVVDEAKLPLPAANQLFAPIGVGYAFDGAGGTFRRVGMPIYDKATQKVMLLVNEGSVVSNTVPFAASADDLYWLKFTLPVAGWSPGGDSTITAVPAAAQNDWGPSGIEVASYVRVNPAASSIITGIASAGVAVQRKTLLNVSAFVVTLKNEDTGSVAANRIVTSPGSGFELLPNDAVDVFYDSVSARWRTV